MRAAHFLLLIIAAASSDNDLDRLLTYVNDNYPPGQIRAIISFNRNILNIYWGSQFTVQVTFINNEFPMGVEVIDNSGELVSAIMYTQEVKQVIWLAWYQAANATKLARIVSAVSRE